MDPAKLVLTRPDRRTQREAVIDLAAKTFGKPYWNWVAHCRESYLDYGPYDWSASTIGLLDGRIVTHWGVWGLRMRIGRCAVRVGGIGAVSTHGDMRNRGLMARTAIAACQAMRQAGYDLSVLFGIRGFYHRFGYVSAWPKQSYLVHVDDLPSARPAGRLRKIAARHRPELAALYNRVHAGLTGTAVRPTYLRRSVDWEGHSWADAAGKPAGYVFIGTRHRPFGVYDYAGDVEEVLRVVARLARRRGEKEVRFHELHHDSDLARRLRRGNCRVEIGYTRCGDAMVRTLNLASTLAKIAPELSARLRRSHLADWHGRLLIADSREKALLSIARSEVAVAPPAATKHAIRGGDEIAQLLIGTDEPAETVAAHGIRLAGDARKLLPVLFPAQHPLLGPWDHF